MGWKYGNPGCACCTCGQYCVTVLGCSGANVGAGFTVTLKKGVDTVGTCVTDSLGKCCITITEAGSDYYVTVDPPVGSKYAQYNGGPFLLLCITNNFTINLTTITGWECVSCCNGPSPQSVTVSLPCGVSLTIPTGLTWTCFHITGPAGKVATAQDCNDGFGTFACTGGDGEIAVAVMVYCEGVTDHKWRIKFGWWEGINVPDCSFIGHNLYSRWTGTPCYIVPCFGPGGGLSTPNSSVDVELTSVSCNGSSFSGTADLPDRQAGSATNPCQGTVAVSS